MRALLLVLVAAAGCHDWESLSRAPDDLSVHAPADLRVVDLRARDAD